MSSLASKHCSLAILGTGSDVGKSILTAGICRVLANGGANVAPFKAQNMSNNAHPALLSEGDGYGEIGIAQAIQAQACRKVPRVEMNPILLKSGGRRESDGAYLCSVFVLGTHYATEDFGALGNRTETLMQLVLDAHAQLDADVVIIEGAGSCTELNLMDRDVVNIPLVRKLNCPWLLVANIDPGGVFAQIVGTKACLSTEDWDLCAGVIVNKLRGEAKYFEPGPSMLETIVGKPIFVIPYLYDIGIADEDGMGLERKLSTEHTAYDEAETNDGKIRVLVICYPHISMTDDLLPVEQDARYQVEWRRMSKCTAFPSVIVLPGSRQTRSDLKWLLQSHWKDYLLEHVANGGIVLGLCGGYQMLGYDIIDDLGVESESAGSEKALGILPVTTSLGLISEKVVRGMQKATILLSPPVDENSLQVEGYEIHCGKTSLVKVDDDNKSTTAFVAPAAVKDTMRGVRPLLRFQDGRVDGCTNGKVHGTYLHGILQSRAARSFLLGRGTAQGKSVVDGLEDDVDPLNRLALHLERHGLDYGTLAGLMNKIE